jgi:uncharacterized protein YjbJ (UPF0337 family)
MTMAHNPITWEEIAGKWKQIKGEVKMKWGRLTDDDLLQIGGNRQVLMGKIQERYGVAKEEAHRQIDEWVAKLKL